MLGSAGSVQTAPSTSVGDGVALRGGVLLPWRALLAAALLTLAVGVALDGGLGRGGAPVAPAPGRAHGMSPKGLLSLPLAAQGMVSATLGADDPAYRITASGGGFQAQSPAQRLRMRFGSAGVQIGQGKTQVGLSLRAIGYGTALHAVDDARPSANANRVTYKHAGLSEWYRNGPLGLEQGFTIARAPSGHPTGALTLSMAVSGNVHASPAAGGQSITFTHPGDPSLRYGGLIATDAGGRALHSRLALYRGRIMLRVDTRGARYPLRIDPLIQGAELVPGGESDNVYSVAISADEHRALIGSPDDNEHVGAAWVFTRSGSTWTLQGEKLTGSEESGGAQFGGSVALSADGNTALIGGSTDSAPHGAAWVFTRSGSTRMQQGGKLTGGGQGIEGGFGASVALSADGNTALIGAPLDFGVGAAWVFTRSGTTWTQQGEKLRGSEEIASSQFGTSVALSSDGNTALIGGPGDNGSIGAAWVFTRSGETWTQQGEKLTGAEEIGENRFGESVALSSDGNIALVGGPGQNGSLGAAWVFTRLGSTWSQQGAKLTGSDEGSESEFGYRVALSSEGTTALIGGPQFYPPFSIGAAWVFARSGSTWTQQGTRLTLSGEPFAWGGDFGESVALSSNANIALISGVNNEDAGAVWVFANPVAEPPTVEKVSPTKGPAAGGTSVTITGSGFVAGATVEIGQGNGAGPTAIPASNVTVVSPTEIIATTGGSAKAGTWNLFVIDSGGTSPANTGDDYTYNTQPTVSSVSPASGTVTGGTNITITGTGFVAGATVEIGQGNGAGPTAIPASDVVVVSATEITAITGGSTKAGVWNVFVVDSGGTSAANTGDDYTYTSSPPTVSSVSPASGTVTGGTPITITGTGFVAGATVEIGQGNGAGPTAIPASNVTVVSPTEIIATTGGSAKAGTWNLFVIDSGGTSPANTGDDYTYKSP